MFKATFYKLILPLLISAAIFYPENIFAIDKYNSCAKYGIIVNFDKNFIVRKYEGKALACIAKNNNIQLRYYIFHAGKGNTLNIKKIQDDFFKVTSALRYPQPFFDRTHYLSSINFIRNNEVLPDVFINKNKKKGFYFHAASEKTAAFIAFESVTSLNNNELFDFFNLTQTSTSIFYKTWMGILILSPIIILLLLTIPNKFKTSFWRSIDFMRSYGVNAVFSIILLPAAILLAFWGFGFQTVGFSVAIAATVLVMLIIIRSIYRYLNKPIILLRLNKLPKFLFTIYSRESTTTVMDAPVHIRHSQHLTAWVAHPQECIKCNSQYAIYTPYREEKSTGSWTKENLSKNEVESMLDSALKKMQHPINGCPKCHSTLHISQEALNGYYKETKKDNWYAVVFLLVGGVGAYIVHLLTSKEIIKSGMLIDSIKFISSWIPFSFQDSYMIGGSVILSSLYASYRLFSHKRGYGLWACSKEGYIFENINPSADLEQVCPSCNNEMVPIKDVKIK
jgi:hypothetical protein